jgi:PTS system nitrogen regulatory IIA component
MKIKEILTIDNIRANAQSETKKNALELMSQLLLVHEKTLDLKSVFTNIVTRERLGTTGIGHGVAIPHCRMIGVKTPLASLVHLAHPINFDAPDDQPVDLLFGLLLPEKSTDVHLQLLADIASKCSKPEYRDNLRNANNNETLFQLVISEL